MDISAQVGELVKFLGPALPFLLKAGERAAEKAGEQLASGALGLARSIWSRLQGHPDVEKAAQDLASMPNDPDAQAALRLQLKKLLTEDPTLAQELAQLWEQAPRQVCTVIAQGERSVAIGGSASGNIIITGDRNRVGGNT